MQNFIAQSMRRAGLAPANKGPVSSQSPTNKMNQTGTAPDSHMKIGSKWSYSTLEYPADIQERSDLGHYMMFYINVHDSSRSEYSTYKSMADKVRVGGSPGTANRQAEAKQDLNGAREAMRNETEYSAKMNSDKWGGAGNNTWQPGRLPRVVGREHHQGRLSITLKRPKRTKRTTDSIVLYMPPTIQTNTNAVYKSGEIGGMTSQLAAQASTIYSRAQSVGWFDAVMEQVPNLVDQGINDTQRAITKALGALMGGDSLTAGADKMSNRAENRFLESLFDNIGFRKFSYTFKFTPKNVNESFIARNIIKTFRFHMTPELPEVGDYGRYFIIPAEFDLFYMFRGDENTWLNKITSCVLTNMDVNYANGKYQTFRPVWGKGNEGAPPTEIEMKLDFMETRIITKREIMEGY